MHVRPVLAAVAALAAVAGGAAGAAPAPVCNLVTDAKGDAFLVRYQQTANELGVPAPYGPQEDTLDIVSADIAANAKTITAVIRVVKLAKSASTAPAGLQVRVQFATPTLDGDTNLYMDGRVQDGKETFTAGSRAITANLSTPLSAVTGVFDLAKNEVRISAPVSVFAPLTKITVGSKILFLQSDGGSLDQTASRIVATNPTNGAATAAFADVTSSDKTYTVGAKSCVVPGK